MRSFKPKLSLGVLWPPQAGLQDKFGGMPWAFPMHRWPNCGTCAKPLSHLFQLQHHPERLDLGKVGRVLTAFQCNHDPGGCETWSADSGANRVIILEPADLILGEVKPFTVDAEVEPEAMVVDWIACDEPVGDTPYGEFFRDESYRNAFRPIESLVESSTKLGGVPTWIQSAAEGPKAPFRFTAQFDCHHRFDGAPPTADEIGGWISRRRADGTYETLQPRHPHRVPGAPQGISVSDDGTFSCDSANYGDMGMAYLFVSTADSEPIGKLFWQCS